MGNSEPQVYFSDLPINNQGAPLALIYLIRHGQETVRGSGARDPGLSDLGREQATAMAARMRAIGPCAIVSSPLARARETAAPLAEFWRTKPVIEHAIKEVPSPPGEDRAAWWDRVSTGSWDDAGDAVAQWCQDIIDYLGGLQNDTVIFSHFVVISAMVGVATGSQRIDSFRPGNCSVTILDVKDGVLSLVERGFEASKDVR